MPQPLYTQASPSLCLLPQIYWFKDGKQISPKNDHYSIRSDPSGTCSLHTAASTLEDDGNYTVMAANPQVGSVGGLGSALHWCGPQRRLTRWDTGPPRPLSSLVSQQRDFLS